MICLKRNLWHVLIAFSIRFQKMRQCPLSRYYATADRNGKGYGFSLANVMSLADQLWSKKICSHAKNTYQRTLNMSNELLLLKCNQTSYWAKGAHQVCKNCIKQLCVTFGYIYSYLTCRYCSAKSAGYRRRGLHVGRMG